MINQQTLRWFRDEERLELEGFLSSKKTKSGMRRGAVTSPEAHDWRGYWIGVDLFAGIDFRRRQSSLAESGTARHKNDGGESIRRRFAERWPYAGLGGKYAAETDGRGCAPHSTRRGRSGGPAPPRGAGAGPALQRRTPTPPRRRPPLGPTRSAGVHPASPPPPAVTVHRERRATTHPHVRTGTAALPTRRALHDVRGGEPPMSRVRTRLSSRTRTRRSSRTRTRTRSSAARSGSLGRSMALTLAYRPAAEGDRASEGEGREQDAPRGSWTTRRREEVNEAGAHRRRDAEGAPHRACVAVVHAMYVQRPGYERHGGRWTAGRGSARQDDVGARAGEGGWGRKEDAQNTDMDGGVARVWGGGRVRGGTDDLAGALDDGRRVGARGHGRGGHLRHSIVGVVACLICAARTRMRRVRAERICGSTPESGGAKEIQRAGAATTAVRARHGLHLLPAKHDPRGDPRRAIRAQGAYDLRERTRAGSGSPGTSATHGYLAKPEEDKLRGRGAREAWHKNKKTDIQGELRKVFARVGTALTSSRGAASKASGLRGRALKIFRRAGMSRPLSNRNG
ncbi:hypothetical protein C8R44DRAFT_749338 [Mycena epipterygia]|nr:hypothetical protein C8R44DRAFT_749338 [Mycena epipterygia]